VNNNKRNINENKMFDKLLYVQIEQHTIIRQCGSRLGC